MSVNLVRGCSSIRHKSSIITTKVNVKTTKTAKKVILPVIG
jgi:hypothetical protein